MKKEIFILLVLFVYGCAQIKSPTGGDKDVKGPEIVSSIPANQSINYRGKEIRMEFNEHIKEENLLNKLVISPPSDSTFEYKIIKKKLSLKFYKNFKENTTYTLNFGEAIKDITEGNPAKNVTFTFSTGPTLDSLHISGKVTDLQTGQGVKDALIGLYSAGDTLTPSNSKPSYIIKSEHNGNFLLQNLKEGKYFIYSISDADKNLKYTNHNEAIGFIADTLLLFENIDSLKIPIQKFDLRPLKVTRKTAVKEDIEIAFNKGVTNLRVFSPTDSTQNWLYVQNKEANKLTLFNSFNVPDSVTIKLQAVDSFDIRIDTVLTVAFKKDEKPKRKKVDKEQQAQTFSLLVEPQASIIKTTDVYLQSELPLQRIDIQKIYFYKDSLTRYNLEEKDLNWNNNKTRASILKDIPFKDSLYFTAEYNSLINVKGDTNTVKKKLFTKKNNNEYGSIGGTVDIKETNFIVQLLKKDDGTKLEAQNKKHFNFDFLDPGIYLLKVLVDENKNGKWDRGDLSARIEPEKIIHFFIVEPTGKITTELSLKANWELNDNVITDK